MSAMSALCALKVKIVGQHLEQYLFWDFASRRKLHPHHSQYLASRIIAPVGTLCLSYSCGPSQRARGSLRLGAAEVWGRSLISNSAITSIFISVTERTKCAASAVFRALRSARAFSLKHPALTSWAPLSGCRHYP